MKRIVNVRLPVMLACALAAGIAFGYLFIRYDISLVWITAVFAFTAVIFILCVIFTKKFILAANVLLVSALFITGAAYGYLTFDSYGTSSVAYGHTYTITATVCGKGETDNGEYIIVNSVKADDERISGKIIVYLGKTYGDFCDVGYEVEFSSQINKIDTFTYGKLNYYAQENVKYSCNVYGGLKAKYRFSFASVRSKIRDILYDNLDSQTAAVAFAMLTGDTQDIDAEALTSFRYGGIAHIFAVSGLHIGILFGILHFITKKLRVNKYVSAAVCILPVFLYAGLCGFTLSSVRAAIMCAVALLSRLIHKKYDGMNSLAVSVIIILIITPLSLFSAGLQLSVCAVAGISILSKNIAKPLKKLPRKISDAISVSLSAQLATMPVMLINFGYISLAGLLLNIIILPLLSIVFVILFISVITTSVLLFTSVILSAAALPLELSISFLTSAGFENALISGFGSGAFAVIYFTGLIIISDKLNLRKLFRFIGAVTTSVCLCTFVIMMTFTPISGYKICVSAYYGGGQVMIKSVKGTVLIVTEKFNCDNAVKMLNDNYASDLSAVIILGGEDCVTALNSCNLNCDAYVYFAYLNLQPYKEFKVNYKKAFSVAGIDFDYADGYSITAECDGAKISVCGGNYVPVENCGLLVSDCADNDCECEFSISFNNRKIEDNVYDCGDFYFYAREGKIFQS